MLDHFDNIGRAAGAIDREVEFEVRSKAVGRYALAGSLDQRFQIGGDARQVFARDVFGRAGGDVVDDERLGVELALPGSSDGFLVRGLRNDIGHAVLNLLVKGSEGRALVDESMDVDWNI